MNFAEYPALALRTEKPLPTQRERLRHAALGLITEIGEIATEIKRIAIYGKSLDAERRAHIAEEIGDTLWYMAIAADAIEWAEFATLPQLGHLPVDANMLTDMALMAATQVGQATLNLGNGLPISAEVLRGLGQVLVDLAHVIGVPLEQIAADNIAKLRERFPDAYSNEAAEARADKGGLDARNS